MTYVSSPFGTPVPNTAHAVSVSMPAWQDVVDYEEASPRAVAQMKNGYPRFYYHTNVRALCLKILEEAGTGKGEDCLVFPSESVAWRCCDFLARHGFSGRLQPVQAHGVCAVIFSKEAAPHARAFWQHSGMIVSSRLAEAVLEKRLAISKSECRDTLCKRVSTLAGAIPEDVYLYPTGMGAIFEAYRLVTALRPQAKTIQLGFPYLDTLKVQEKFGAGCHYIDYRTEDDFQALETILAKEPIAGVFCEFPTNPLLVSVDLERLFDLLRRHQVPLVIDDTLAAWLNADIGSYADIAVTSLTKFFSGVGDVMAGSLTLYRHSPFYDSLKRSLTATYEDLLFDADVEVLEQNSRDFEARMRRINATAEQLCDYLRAHPAIAHVYYPKYVTSDTYEKYRREGGGYGGLFSLVLKNEKKAPLVYDRLPLTKGPSLGTNYTLVCPYTLLAHYRELDFAAGSGVSASLIRVSVGLEDAEILIEAFAKALEEV